MRAKLIVLEYFEQFDNTNNAAKLLMEVKAVLYKYKGHHNPYLALNSAKSTIHSYFQNPYKSNTFHSNTFQTLLEVVEYHGGSLCCNFELTKIELEKSSNYRAFE